MNIRLKQVVIFLATFLLVFTSSVSANPSGEQIVAGHAGFNRAGNQLNINQLSDRVIINWQDFSIANGELTKFIQPSNTSAALNRVVTGNLSSLLGDLKANGHVYLINPNGIVVGAGANINTQSFIASTLDVDNAAFMNGGDLNFIGDSQNKIENLGTINGGDGDVFLIARHVDNSGTINASGQVGLAGGKDVLLKASGDDRLAVRVTDNDGRIDQKGLIEAAKIELKTAGNNPYALAINHEGISRATSAFNKQGRIILSGGDHGTVQVSGTLDASGKDSGETGGQVMVLGETIALVDEARIDVSGDVGGGEVLIGGDLKGKNPDIKNAQTNTVGEKVFISADAVTSGNGGKVIVWADQDTAFFGKISARGGVLAGDGGFVEVSGKESWLFPNWFRAVDISAPSGNSGTFLIDPNDITIQDGSGSAIGSSPTNANTLNDGDIVDFLTNTGSLEIETTGSGGNGDITVDNDVDIAWATANDLTLDADRDITFSSGGTPTFQASGGGSITFEADRHITLEAGSSITTNTGAITLTADFDSNGMGDFMMHSGDTIQGGGVMISGSQLDLGNVSTSGAQTYTGTNIDLNGTSYTSDDGTIAFIGAVDLVGAGISVDSDADNDSTDGNISFSSTVDGAQSLNLDADSGSVTLSGAVGGTTKLSSLMVSAASQVDLADVSTTGAQSITGTNIDLNGTSYTSDDGTIAFIGAVDLNAGGAITVDSDADADSTDGNISFSSTVDGGQSLSLDADTGTVTMFGDVGGTTSLSSLLVSAASQVDLANVSTTGAQSITGTNIDLNGTSYVSHDGNIAFIGAVDLVGAGISVDSDADNDSTDGNISFSSTVDGAQSLSLDADTGTVALSGAVGGTTKLSSLMVSAASQVDLANVSTTGAQTITGTNIDLNGTSYASDDGNIMFTGAVDLNASGAVTVNSDADNDSTDGNISFSSTVDGTQDLILNAGTGDVTTNGSIGTGGSSIGALTISGNDINIDANVEASAISLTASEGSDADSIDITGVTLDANGGNIDIATDDLITGGTATLSSSGGANASVTITGETAGSRIEIGDSTAGMTALSLSEAELQDVDSSISEIIIGFDTTQSGTIEVDESGGLQNLNTGLRLRGEAGLVDIDSAIDLGATAGASFTVEGPSDLNGDITTAGGAVTFTDTVNLLANTVVNTGTGVGDINLNGIVTGSNNDLQLISGSGSTTANAALNDIGELTLQENAATSTGAVVLNNNVTASTLTTFGQNYAVSLLGTNNMVTTSTTFNNTGGVVLGNGSGDSLTFSNGVTSTASTTSLAGTVQTANDSTITLGVANLTTDTTLISDEIDLGGAVGGGGFALVLQPDEIGDGIQVGTGATGGADILVIDAAEIGRFTDDTFSQITIGRSDGEHAITVNAASFVDPVTIQTPAGGSITVNGQLDTLAGNDAAAIVLDGAGFTTFLNANVVTAGGAITFSDAVQVGDDASVIVDSTDGGNVSTGATITFDNSVDGHVVSSNGGEALLVNGGTGGTVTFDGAVGSSQPLDTLTVTNSNGTVFNDAVNVGSLVLTDTTDGQAIAFNGNTTITTGLTTTNEGYSLSLTGSSNSVAGETTFNNTGGVTIGNDSSGDAFTFTNGVIIENGVTLRGDSSIVGDLTVKNGGIIAPGSSDTVAGIFNLTGNLTLETGATFKADLNVVSSDTAGVDYDQIKVLGAGQTVELIDGAILDFEINSVPQDDFSADITLIDNNTGNAIVGTFDGMVDGFSDGNPDDLSDGALFTDGDFVGRIEYTRGGGNDVTIFSKTVKVDNPSGSNYTLSRNGNNLEFAISGGSTSAVEFIDSSGSIVLTQYVINAGAGDDSLTVDYGSDAFFPILVIFNGGDADGAADMLTLNHTSPVFDTVTYSSLNSLNDGTIEIIEAVDQVNGTISKGKVQYTGLDTSINPITDNITATNRVFSFTGGAETITLSDNVITTDPLNPPASDSITSISSDLAGGVDFLNPTVGGSLTIETRLGAGTGPDTVNIGLLTPVLGPLDPAFDASLTVNGDSNAGTGDTINLNGTLSVQSGALSFTGNEINFNTGEINSGGGQVYNATDTVTTESITFNDSVTFNGDFNIRTNKVSKNDVMDPGKITDLQTNSVTATFNAEATFNNNLIIESSTVETTDQTTGETTIETNGVTTTFNDTLNFNSDSSVESNLTVENAAFSKTIDVSGVTTSIEEITSGTHSDMNITVNGSVNAENSTFTGGAGNETFNFVGDSSGTDTLILEALNGGSGDDNFQFFAYDEVTIDTVNGGAGSDDFVFGFSAFLGGTNQGAGSVDRGPGSNSVTINNNIDESGDAGIDRFLFHENGTVTVNGDTNLGDGNDLFDFFDNALVEVNGDLAGGDGDDIFIFEHDANTTGTINGNVNGGDGANQFRFLNASPTIITGDLISGTGVDTFELSRDASIQVTNINSGDGDDIFDLNTNTSIQATNINSGGGDDTFTLQRNASIEATNINSGGGNDNFNLANDSSIQADIDLGTDDDIFKGGNNSAIDGLLDGGSGNDTLEFAAFGLAIDIVLTGPGTIDGFMGTASAISGGFDNINEAIASVINIEDPVGDSEAELFDAFEAFQASLQNEVNNSNNNQSKRGSWKFRSWRDYLKYINDNKRRINSNLWLSYASSFDEDDDEE